MSNTQTVEKLSIVASQYFIQEADKICEQILERLAALNINAEFKSHENLILATLKNQLDKLTR